jgi:alpha-glucosidase (family GH31 glycosyl hydrolase)
VELQELHKYLLDLELEGVSNWMSLEIIAKVLPFEKLPKGLQDLLGERSLFPPGPLSRSGFFLYNDTSCPVIDSATGRIRRRNNEPGDSDLYLFCYQRDYKQALADYRRLFGPTVLIPRYSLGLWCTPTTTSPRASYGI